MLVEGATGEPLWANLAASTDEHPKLDLIVKELLKPLPAARRLPRQERERKERLSVPETSHAP
jgi:hypothetical protein